MRIDEPLVGPWRNPLNLSADARESIHDDRTAMALGFRGGTVAGNIHLVQFVPLLHGIFGDEWFETGTLSVMFRNATTDSEPVRAIIEPDPRPGAGNGVRVRLDSPDGTLVAEGTASIGSPSAPSLLRDRDVRPVDPGELTMLRNVSPGLELPARPVVLSGDNQRHLLGAGLLSEPHEYYRGPTPWGGPIASPLSEVDLLTPVERDLRPLLPDGVVGMYGAIELRHHGRPVLLERTYEVGGRVLAVSDSPRTEILWYESTAALDGEAVVTMLMMTRLVKRG
jgi:hypothetical protein